MGTRGRRSGAELEIVTPGTVVALRRPDAPAELTDEQASEWHLIVNRMPADWFPSETRPLLVQYCRHVVAARRVAAMIDTEEAKQKVDVDTLDKLYKMQEREGRAISSLATRMRLTQQSTYDKSKKKGRELSRPWD